METINSRERQRARAIADEYCRQGYEVIEEPSTEQLPGFLSSYHPDLLVRKGDEAKIVEVKSRSSLAKAPQIRDLAKLLHNRPNWSFELVFVGEESPFGDLEEDVRPFKNEDILQGIETAEKLVDSGFAEAALMSAWSTAEAAIRLLNEAEGITLERFDPPYILMQAATNGVISREDYHFLTKVMKRRNALAHGFKTVDFDPALVRELVSTTKRLLQAVTEPQFA